MLIQALGIKAVAENSPGAVIADEAPNSGYVKSFAFQSRIHHCANRIIVIHEQDSVGNEPFNRTHTALPSGHE